MIIKQQLQSLDHEICKKETTICKFSYKYNIWEDTLCFLYF